MDAALWINERATSLGPTALVFAVMLRFPKRQEKFPDGQVKAETRFSTNKARRFAKAHKRKFLKPTTRIRTILTSAGLLIGMPA